MTTGYRSTRIFDALEADERSQAWLARKVGCSRAFVTLIKNGDRPIPLWFAERAAALFDVPVDDLFFDPIFSAESDLLAEAERVAVVESVAAL